MTFISEGNLFRLIIKSRKPEAQGFEREVMEVILPAIRKTGQYATTEPLEDTTGAVTHGQRLILEDRIYERYTNSLHRHSLFRRIKQTFGIETLAELPTARFQEALDLINTGHVPARRPRKSANPPAALPSPEPGSSYCPR